MIHLSSRTAGQVHAVYPGLENVGIGPPVRVCGKSQPFAGQIARYVERSVLRIAHEGGSGVLRAGGPRT